VSDDSAEKPNLMHLAADLLDLDLDGDDIPELTDEDIEEIQDYPQDSLGTMADYEFVSRFEGSDMTDVYLAHKLSRFGFVRRAVVKRAKPSSDMYEISREMLLDEAKALAWLDHPNIVSILDFGEDAGGFYLAMEHVDGTDLRYVNMSLRKRREALPFEVAVYICIEILRGLHHAHTILDPDGHALDILHRDVNPTNVLISRSGHIKLTDFGVVRMRDRLQAKTQPGIVKGKFSYMTREYILGRKCDCRLDLYAVGIMLLEMLTGRPCFSKLSVHSVMKKVVEHDLPLHRMEAQNIPAHLDQIVSKATAREPEDRFSSASSMANELETWLMRSGGHASPWIISAFLEQHKLFSGRVSSHAAHSVPALSLPEKVENDAQKTQGASIDNHQEKTAELLVDVIDDSASNGSLEQIKSAEATALDNKPKSAKIAHEFPADALTESGDALKGAASISKEQEIGESVRPVLEPVGEAEMTPCADEELSELPRHQAIDPNESWEGSIGDPSVAEIIEVLIRKQASGEVRFENRALRKQIYVRQGQCIAVKTNVGMEDLSELLILQKVITRSELDRMMLGPGISDPEIGKRLIGKNKLTHERFAKIHGQQVQSCLEDVLTWRSGKFKFTPQKLPEPLIVPALHIELLLLPHLSESKGKPHAKSRKKPRPASTKPRAGGSLAEALRMARKVTGNRGKAHSDRINSDDE
jgi:serine/threonine protein kinase